MSKQRPSINYVNNADFYQRIVEWKATGDDKIPDDIAATIMMICKNLAKSGKFAGYSWIEAMVGDAILACIKFCRNFDPEKSKNPFAFYTQIAYNSFLKRIQIEKQRLDGLAEYRVQITTLYDIQGEEYDEDDNRYGQIENTAKRINRNYIKKKEQKKNNKQSIENFFEGEDE
jgi:hypothetical protein